jgi:hypothetical protein
MDQAVILLLNTLPERGSRIDWIWLEAQNLQSYQGAAGTESTEHNGSDRHDDRQEKSIRVVGLERSHAGKVIPQSTEPQKARIALAAILSLPGLRLQLHGS